MATAKQQPSTEHLVKNNNEYDLGGLSKNCASKWKEKEHEITLRYCDNKICTTTFWADKIDFFDSHLDELIGDSKVNIIQIEWDVYYCDVHLFVDQTKTIVNVKEICHVWIGLHLCLCSVTQKWYVAELDDIQWDSLQDSHDIINWVNALMTQFKQLKQAALNTLLTQCYTLINVQNKCSSVFYVQTIIQYRRNVNLLMSN